MLVRKLLLWLSTLVLWSAAGAAVAQAPAGTCADPGSSLLWQVTGNGIDQRGLALHLFGSIHLGKPEFYPLHTRIEGTFRAADKLVFEIDPVAAAEPQNALRMQLRGMLPSGQTLGDVVSPAALDNLRTVLDRFGIPLNNFMTMKPWLLTLFLANVQATSLGYSAEHGLEGYFMAQRAPGTTIGELETLDQQVDMLDSLDPELLLGYSLKDFDDSAAEMEELIAAWRCADVDALSERLFSDLKALEAETDPAERAALESLYRRIYTDRNVVMADGVDALAQGEGGAVFVVVGSAHLLGAGSVVELLQNRGYTVTPVRLD
jgi:uncharacterized protein